MILRSISTILILISFLLLSTAQTLTSIESVEYDPTENRWFISNGNIISQANDGTRTVFGTGSASHAMEVMNGNLYTISSGSIKGYDLVSSEEVMSISIAGAGFLNGMTSDGNGKLYVTDFSNRKIHLVNVTDTNQPTQEEIVSNTGVTPNGIVFDGDRNQLIFVTWTSNAAIRSVDLDDYSVSTIITTPYGNIDGIDEDNEGNYYISTWNPSQIVKYNNDFSVAEIVSTPQLRNPADICFAKEINTLGIPHYPNNGNEVILIELSGETDTKDIELITQLSVAPNPYSVESKLLFNLISKFNVDIDIYSSVGNKVDDVFTGLLQSGEHSIDIPNLNMSTGIYYLVIDVEGRRVTKKMIVK